MKIFNAKVFTEDGRFLPGSIQIDKGMITDVIFSGRTDHGELDAHGWLVSPGWIDMQINGGFGSDFTDDPTKIWEVGSRLTQYGVTGFLPTVITAPEEAYRKSIEVSKKGTPDGWKGAIPIGWHFEGPFLNPGKKGAHNPNNLRAPDERFAGDWSRKNGVAMVTMAPELPGALDLAATLISRGVVLSAGHSLATLEDAHTALDTGYTAATHLFNAMPPLDHRAPGLAAVVLLDPRFTAGIIADGVHVHPEMVNLAWRMKGADGIALITDAVGSLGFPPGEFVQGGMEIVVDDTAARLKNGTLAGSILSPDKALRNMMKFTGASIEQILPALSRTQARLLHLDQNGQIKPGYRADLTLFDEAGQVMMTIVHGEVVYSRENE
jgi:N-acetylglucosamine-6-phosphate deacetylase